MEKIKILFISHTADLGGAEYVLWDVISFLNTVHFESYLVVPSEGPLAKKARDAGLSVFLARYRPWMSPKRLDLDFFYHALMNLCGLPGLILLMRRLRPDIVVTNTCTVISGAIASRLCSIAHVWHVHEIISRSEEDFRFLGGNRLAFRIISRTGRRIITNSDFVKSMFPQPFQDRMTTVYCGFRTIADIRAEHERSVLRKTCGLGDSDKIISVIGVICKRKGQAEAVQAMPHLLQEIPSARLLLVGKTYAPNVPYERKIRDFIAAHRLADKIVFMGFKEDLNDVYQMSDCILVPSQSEPFGRVVVEAMLHGVPVVAAAVGGIPEIINDGVTGTLLRSSDPVEIARSVAGMLRRGDLQSMTERARRYAESRFSMEFMKSTMETIFLQMLKDRDA